VIQPDCCCLAYTADTELVVQLRVWSCDHDVTAMVTFGGSGLLTTHGIDQRLCILAVLELQDNIPLSHDRPPWLWL